jgi:hypothetical protein
MASVDPPRDPRKRGPQFPDKLLLNCREECAYLIVSVDFFWWCRGSDTSSWEQMSRPTPTVILKRRLSRTIPPQATKRVDLEGFVSRQRLFSAPTTQTHKVHSSPAPGAQRRIR